MNHRNLQEAPNKVLRKVYDRPGNPGYVLQTLRTWSHTGILRL